MNNNKAPTIQVHSFASEVGIIVLEWASKAKTIQITRSAHYIHKLTDLHMDTLRYRVGYSSSTAPNNGAPFTELEFNAFKWMRKLIYTELPMVESYELLSSRHVLYVLVCATDCCRWMKNILGGT